MLAINGHFKGQPVTGVQRYAREVTGRFKRMGQEFQWVDPPPGLESDALRQLWMQLRMPARVPGGALLWSPTNSGPVFHARQVVTLHDLADQLHPEWFSRRYSAWRSMILPPLLRRVRGIITISDYSRRTILERYPFTEGKIEVIYNGVDSRHFRRRDEEEVGRMRRKLGLSKRYLVTVGSLDPRKNLNRLLDAWHRLPARIREEYELVIAGASSDKFSFSLDRDPGERVRFTGYVDYDDLPALYSGASLFVYPSLFEGFGLPVLEAMACGTPVLTSDTTALGELAGDKAVTVDPQHAGQLGDEMLRLLEAPGRRRELGEKGVAYASGFTWDETARKTLDFLDSCT
ncbi:MAG: glycosyltransferase family 1 protein [Balneolaceae bacterium]|nr:glycosyltransferase family 1 protein [Balneolaceae bacterium]